MLLITFSKAGHDDIVLTEDDIFDWDFEASCFSSDTFELGGVNAKSLYLLIDNNDRRFSRGAFSNSRATLEINGHVYGEFNVELPKRRNGVIEFTAYDDIIKLDCEYPTDYVFPQLFWSVYAQCLFEAGLTSDLSFDSFVLNALFNNGIISHEYTDYIYANSCRQLISGMAEWNGGFVHFNSDNKLQVDVFSKEITKEIHSSQLLEFDYSDETITFSKVKTSFKNKTYEKGDDSGYTLVIKNQYISYGLTDENFETYLTFIYDYYNGFTLTPMTFTLAEPDHELKIGDRISVYDEEEDVTVTGNISKINITGNCTMTITCGGFGNVSSTNNYSPTSVSQNAQTKVAGSGGGTAEKLQTGEDTVSAETAQSEFIIRDRWNRRIANIKDSETDITINYDPYGDVYGISETSGDCVIKISPNEVALDAGKVTTMRVTTEDGTTQSQKVGINTRLQVSTSGITVNNDWRNQSTGAWGEQSLSVNLLPNDIGADLIFFGGGSVVGSSNPNVVMSFRLDGIYINGKKVLTEE